MNKLLVSSCVASSVLLAACGGDTIKDIEQQTISVSAQSRIVFDPADGILSVPNDILMIPDDGAVFDYTLNIPVADASDFSDPTNALNTQDGWSTNYPFQIDVETATGVSIDANSLSAGIRIFEATLGLDAEDADCQAIQIPSAGCKMNDELVFGSDYILTLSDSDTISVVPLVPFKPSQGYMVVFTDALLDSNGNSILGSTSWNLVKQDINVSPLGTDSQLALQGLVNSYIDALAQVGYTRDEITYVQVFTTQSTTNVLETVKQLHLQEFAATSAASIPSIVVSNASSFSSAHEAVVDAFAIDGNALAVSLGLPSALDYSAIENCNGVLAAASGQFLAATAQTTGSVETDAVINASLQTLSGAFAPQCAVDMYEASISVNYYSAISTEDDPTAPLTGFWRSACDSGIALLTTPDEILAAATAGPNAATCAAAGLADLRIGGAMLDSNRFLTKFSPIPQAQGSESGKESLDIQVTVPDVATAAALGFNLTMPENGWPVVILVHGITSSKEAMLNISGALSLAGFATVAIDQPIHGSRGFDYDNDGIDDINATTVSATDYLNLASLATTRDNNKQAISDLLSLRLGLNALFDVTGNVNIDPSNVSLLGVSLGAINGGMFAAVANESLGGDLAAFDSLYKVNAVSLESPGGGLAQFLIESPSFGPLIKASLLFASSEDFQTYLNTVFGTLAVSEAQLVTGYNDFVTLLDADTLASIEAIFGEFAFAAQTMVDSADPLSYYPSLTASTPTHMLTVVGDGGDINLPDQTIPPTTSLPLSGQLPLASVAGLSEVVSTTVDSQGARALVQYSQGVHANSLQVSANAAVYAEMQNQIATFLASGGTTVLINDTSVIAQ